MRSTAPAFASVLPVDEVAALAGAVLCVGVRGPVLEDDERRALEMLRPGAIALFARNVATLAATRALVRELRLYAGGAAPALVCVDQEGGRVVRLRFTAAALPAMLALGATGDAELAYAAGAWLAAEARTIGANVVFGPVLDLALPGATTVIGTRALGDDPAEVARLGARVVRGLQDAGVIATAKHLPGHGATALDSHVALPVLAAGLPLLRGREFVPFRAAISSGIRAAMTAHVVARALDPDRPASLSPRVMAVLRDELAFDGVCFTDCLTMDAVAETAGVAPGAVAALNAGADIVTISRDLDLALAARDAITAAVERGDLPLTRLREAAGRVLAARIWAAPAAEARPVPEGPLPRNIALRAIAGPREAARLDPARPVTVISFEGDAADGIAATSAERPSLSLALRRRRLRSESMRVALEPADETLDALLEIVRAQGARSFVVMARRAERYPAQARALAALFEAAPHAVGVSMLEPFDAPLLAGARAVLRTFGDEETSVEALADVLTGRDGP